MAETIRVNVANGMDDQFSDAINVIVKAFTHLEMAVSRVDNSLEKTAENLEKLEVKSNKSAEMVNKTKGSFKSAEKKMTAFEKSASKTKTLLKRLTDDSYRMLLNITDNVNPYLSEMESKLKSITEKQWSVVIRAKNMFETPLSKMYTEMNVREPIERGGGADKERISGKTGEIDTVSEKQKMSPYQVYNIFYQIIRLLKNKLKTEDSKSMFQVVQSSNVTTINLQDDKPNEYFDYTEVIMSMGQFIANVIGVSLSNIGSLMGNWFAYESNFNIFQLQTLLKALAQLELRLSQIFKGVDILIQKNYKNTTKPDANEVDNKGTWWNDIIKLPLGLIGKIAEIILEVLLTKIFEEIFDKIKSKLPVSLKINVNVKSPKEPKLPVHPKGSEPKSKPGNADNNLGSGLYELLKGIGTGAAEFGRGVGQLGKGIGSGADGLGNGIGAGAKGLGNGIGSGVDGLGNGIGAGVEGLGNGIGAGVKEVGAGVGSAISAIPKGIGAGVKEIGSGIGSAISAIPKGIGAGITEIGSGIGSAISAIPKGIGSIFSEVGRGLGDRISGKYENSGNGDCRCNCNCNSREGGKYSNESKTKFENSATGFNSGVFSDSVMKDSEASDGSSTFSGINETFNSFQKYVQIAIDKVEELKTKIESLPPNKMITILVLIKKAAFIVEDFFEKHADGGILSRPHMGLVAEDGPESIIPLSGKRRNRGLTLWRETGKLLGVNNFAHGNVGEQGSGIEGNSSLSMESPKRKFNMSNSKTEVSEGTRISMEINPVFNIKGNDPEHIAEQVKTQIMGMVDDITNKIADNLEVTFSNMPINA